MERTLSDEDVPCLGEVSDSTFLPLFRHAFITSHAGLSGELLRQRLRGLCDAFTRLGRLKTLHTDIANEWEEVDLDQTVVACFAKLRADVKKTLNPKVQEQQDTLASSEMSPREFAEAIGAYVPSFLRTFPSYMYRY